MEEMDKVKYLIVGNSAGAIGAVEAIRQVDEAGSVAIVSDEPYPAYSRPLISDYLAGKCSLEGMRYRPPDFYEANGVHALLGRKAKGIDINRRSLRLDNGAAITWEKLLLATGGQPIVPPMDGVDSRGVFTFTTLDDAKAIDEHLEEGSRAVVIGGGLIGVSVTEALVKRGARVTIVEMLNRVLNTILDEEASALEAAALEQAGVDIITGHTVARIDADPSSGRVTGTVLDNDEVVPCELVVAAIGVRPRTELASAAGVRTDRGIVVDRHMETSVPSIYACGDVAEAYDFIYGENRLTPIWPNAYLGGRVAGFNMAGSPTEYQGGTAMNSMKYFGVAIASAGMVTPPDDAYTVLSNQRDGHYRKVVLKDNRVVGLVHAGDIACSGIVFSLMRDGVDVGGFETELVADDFGLASLPEEIWRSRLEMPPAGQDSADRAETQGPGVPTGELET